MIPEKSINGRQRCDGMPFHFTAVSHAFGHNDGQQYSSTNGRYRQTHLCSSLTVQIYATVDGQYRVGSSCDSDDCSYPIELCKVLLARSRRDLVAPIVIPTSSAISFIEPSDRRRTSKTRR